MFVDSLMEINNIITGSNKITWRRVDVKPHGFNRLHMYKDPIEDKFFQMNDQLSERKITPTKFYSIPLNEINSFTDGNGKRCKILFAKDGKIVLEMRWKFKNN